MTRAAHNVAPNAPLTYFYHVRDRQWGWARAWVTSDGCLTIMSDWGNYAYWWFGDNGDHRRFLASCGVDYIENKLAGGKMEIDADATVRGIKDRIARRRREGGLSRAEARAEWELVDGVDFESERDMWVWYDATELDDACEVLCHRRPLQLQMFMRHCWPLLVVEMRADYGATLRDRARDWFRRAA